MVTIIKKQKQQDNRIVFLYRYGVKDYCVVTWLIKEGKVLTSIPFDNYHKSLNCYNMTQ